MSTFQPPPTYAEVVLYDKNTKDVEELIKSAKFNPIWLKWFLDLSQNLSTAGAGSVTAVTAGSPLSSTGGNTPNITLSGTVPIGNGGTGNTTGTATVNANLTGPITSTGNATAVAAQTGTGTTFVMDTGPTIANLHATGVFQPPFTSGVAQTVVTLYAGNGVPNNSHGADGDFYFRGNGTAAGDNVIYHREAGAWVALVTT